MLHQQFQSTLTTHSPIQPRYRFSQQHRCHIHIQRYSEALIPFHYQFFLPPLIAIPQQFQSLIQNRNLFSRRHKYPFHPLYQRLIPIRH